MQRISAPLSLLVAALGLSGCIVTPSPLSESEVESRVESAVYRTAADQEPVAGTIDLYEAMARALKYNLEHRVEAMEAALRVRELDLAHFSLLPNVVATSGYAGRDNYNAANSINVLTGQQSLSTSTSQEKRISTADIAFSWNILDFGLSYVRARQAADKYLIAEELRRRVIGRVVEEVRTAYWRTVSADRLIAKLRVLEGRVRRAQANSRSTAADRQTSPITAAVYERELIEIKRAIHELQRDLVVARTQLATLMNVPAGVPFALSGNARRSGPALTMSVREMVETSLRHRPELKELWYRQRISEQEAHAALLELLPGLTPYAGNNWDSNEFLYNSNWVSWGAKASWNLLRIVQYPAKREVLDAQNRVLDARALATTVAVVTQVHVSRIRFHHYRSEQETANEYLGVQTRLLALMRAEAAAGRISEQTLIREEMNTLIAEAKTDIAQAALQNAFATVYTSMGLDPYTTQIDLATDVKTIAEQLRGLWLERGDRLAETGRRRR
jgi:outer membrane protein TolC